MMFIWRRGGRESIANKVAIIGMGGTKIGENWQKSAEGMLVDAAYEGFADAGISPQGMQSLGQSLSQPLTLPYILQ
jgi:hypothetical protein